MELASIVGARFNGRFVLFTDKMTIKSLNFIHSRYRIQIIISHMIELI
jgi:hypothetical protein